MRSDELGRRKKIALLSGDLSYEDTYPDQLWKAIFSQAKLRNCDLYFLLGRSREETDPDDPSTGLFRLMRGMNFDGIIVSPALITSRDSAHFNAILKHFPEVPRVFLVDCEFEGMTIGVDNTTGMNALMDHLIFDHKKVKIAHLSGPLGHLEARIRKQCWADRLTRAGIDFDESWSLECDWRGLQTEACVRTLWDKMGGFDALVCSNDAPALLSIPVLRKMGLRVPEDVAVTGFDGLNSTFLSDPPLTTVAQPFFEQLDAGFDYLLSNAKNKTKKIMIPSQFVARSSCGCDKTKWSKVPLSKNVLSLEAPPDLKLVSAGDFESWLRSKEVRTSVLCSIEQELFLLGQDSKDAKYSSMLELVRNKLRFDLHNSLVESQRLADVLNTFAKKLTTDLEFGVISNALKDLIKGFGLKSFCLSLVCDESGKTQSFSSTTLESLLPTAPKHLIHLSSSPLIRPSAPIFKSDLLCHPDWAQVTTETSFYVVPLVSHSAWYGIIVIEANPDQSLIIRSLQELLSEFFDRSYNYADLVETATRERAKSQYESERMTELTHLIGGISHEFNTPLGTSLTALGFIENEINLLQKGLNESSLTKDFFESKLRGQKKSLELIERNLLRLHNLMQNFKNIAVNNQSAEIGAFELDRVLNETVGNLISEISEKNIVIRTNFMSNFAVTSKIVPLFEIVKSVVQNAIIHGKMKDKDLIIDISFEPSGSKSEIVSITIANNGQKINEDVLPNIFKPFFSTRMQEGRTGLGLYIVHNLVKQGLQGDIKVESDETRTEFVLSFPRHLTG